MKEKEHQSIEWKESWQDEYLKWICGYANAYGGTIYIGTDDDGNVVGIDNARDLLERIPNKITDTMGIIADVNLLYKGKLEYLQIIVDKYPSLISFRGKYYYRSGSTMREITGKELERALLKTQGRTWDGVPLPKLTVADLKQDAIQLFKDKAVKRGRLTKEGECLYVKKGDMAINMKAGVKSYSYFPQSHYHGVTIEIDFDKIEKNQNMIMKEMQLSPKILQDKFCNHKQCIVLHEKQEFEHLFSEIYCVPEQIKKSYYKIKVMEILLFLFALDTTKEKIENRYFNKNLVAKVKEIHQYMLNHIDEKLTIACLADKHQISVTNLKKYFKEIYGLSIYAYLKEKRIQKAAELLRETNHEIGKIAGMVGYDNASKFSNSFKSIMGINPSEYKKSV